MPCSACGGNKNRRAAPPPPPPPQPQSQSQPQPQPRVQLNVTPKQTIIVNRVTPARTFHQTPAFILSRKRTRNITGPVRNKTMIFGTIK